MTDGRPVMVMGESTKDIFYRCPTCLVKLSNENVHMNKYGYKGMIIELWECQHCEGKNQDIAMKEFGFPLKEDRI